MSFDMNPADEDPHGECLQEIERLTAKAAGFDAIVTVMEQLGMPTELDEVDGEPYWPMCKWLRDLKADRDEYKRLCEWMCALG